MKKELITKLHGEFEKYAETKDGIEYWYARALQELLGYTEWRNFALVIDKARISCKNAGHPVDDHFVDVNKMVDVGSGAQREVPDIALTRYACYLIAQNGDPRKTEIAFAQTYFAVQTRKQEIIEKRIAEWERLQAREKLTLSEKELSHLIYERGIDHQGFARIRSKGDSALEKLRNLIRLHLKAFQDDRNMAVVYQMETHQINRSAEEQIKAMSKMYLDLLSEIIDQGQEEGSVRKDLYLGLVKRFMVGAIDEVINTWLHSKTGYDLVSMADPLVELLINGVGTSRDKQ